MEIFADYIAHIENPQHRSRMEEVLRWVSMQFPNLIPKIAWNQPMFTDHGTFIIGFSVSQKHLAVAPERAAISRFSDEIVKAGYDHTKELVRIPWDGPLKLILLESIIKYNIDDKINCLTFWRK